MAGGRVADNFSKFRVMDDNNKQICGNCLLCIHTYQGCECNITDNSVDCCQEACIDYIKDDEEDY